LLYNFIQNNTITIEREFGETIFNDLMREEEAFYHTCIEILNIKIEKKQGFTWKLIKNIWTKIELETIKIKTPSTRVKSPRNKAPAAVSTRPAAHEEQNTQKNKTKTIEELNSLCGSDTFENTYNRNTLLRYNTRTLTKNIDKKYQVIDLQKKNTLAKFAREQIATNPKHKTTYQNLLINISTNHGAKARYKEYKNISVATRKKDRSDRGSVSRVDTDPGAPVTGTLRRQLPSTDPAAHHLLTPSDRCAGGPSTLTGLEGGKRGSGSGDPTTTDNLAPAQKYTTPYRDTSLTHPTPYIEEEHTHNTQNTNTHTHTDTDTHTHTTNSCQQTTNTNNDTPTQQQKQTQQQQQTQQTRQKQRQQQTQQQEQTSNDNTTEETEEIIDILTDINRAYMEDIEPPARTQREEERANRDRAHREAFRGEAGLSRAPA